MEPKTNPQPTQQPPQNIDEEQISKLPLFKHFNCLQFGQFVKDCNQPYIWDNQLQPAKYVSEATRIKISTLKSESPLKANVDHFYRNQKQLSR